MMFLVILLHLLFVTPITGQVSNLCVPTNPLATFDTYVATSTTFVAPYAVRVEPTTGKLIAADGLKGTIYRFATGAGTTGSATPEAAFQTLGSTATQTSLSIPYAITMDAAGRLYVADYSFNRVLAWTTVNIGTTASGTAPNLVFGQTDFVSTSNNDIYQPSAVGLDTAGSLWVGSSFSSVQAGYLTKYTSPSTATNGAAPAFFLTAAASGLAANCVQGGFVIITGITFDASGNMYVSDSELNRVVQYTSATTVTAASLPSIVIGQASFTTCNALTTQAGLNSPYGLFYETSSSVLFVADNGNQRIVAYNAPLTTGASASFEYGQPSFVVNNAYTTVNPFDVTYDNVNTNKALYVADVNAPNIGRLCPASTSVSISLTVTPTNSFSPTNSVTNTVTVTVTNSNTVTNSFTNTNSITTSVTNSYTNSLTSSYSSSISLTNSITRSQSYSPSYTNSIASRSGVATVCGDGILGGTEQCDLGTQNGQVESCCTSSCTLLASGTVCAPAATPCRRRRRCNSIGICDPSRKVPHGKKCRGVNGFCDKKARCQLYSNSPAAV